MGRSINPRTTGGHIHGHGGKIAARVSRAIRVGSRSGLVRREFQGNLVTGGRNHPTLAIQALAFRAADNLIRAARKGDLVSRA